MTGAKRIVRVVGTTELTADDLRRLAAEIDADVAERLAWERSSADDRMRNAAARGEEVAPYEQTDWGLWEAEVRRATAARTARLREIRGAVGSTPTASWHRHRA